jgi:hypothetical protein
MSLQRQESGGSRPMFTVGTSVRYVAECGSIKSVIETTLFRTAISRDVTVAVGPTPERFVHYYSIVGLGYRTQSEGDNVEFHVVQDPDEPQATNKGRTPK